MQSDICIFPPSVPERTVSLVFATSTEAIEDRSSSEEDKETAYEEYDEDPSQARGKNEYRVSEHFKRRLQIASSDAETGRYKRGRTFVTSSRTRHTPCCKCNRTPRSLSQTWHIVDCMCGPFCEICAAPLKKAVEQKLSLGRCPICSQRIIKGLQKHS